MFRPTPLLILGAALIAIGALWWWRSGVGAERPASLLVIVGTGFCAASWWLS
jgi:hypothetical protein